jgi:hypothetical protein
MDRTAALGPGARSLLLGRSLPRQVHGHRVVVRPTGTFERLQRVGEVALHAASQLLADVGPGDPEDAALSLVAGDLRLAAMAVQAIGDRLSLSDVDGRFRPPVASSDQIT